MKWGGRRETDVSIQTRDMARENMAIAFGIESCWKNPKEEKKKEMPPLQSWSNEAIFIGMSHGSPSDISVIAWQFVFPYAGSATLCPRRWRIALKRGNIFFCVCVCDWIQFSTSFIGDRFSGGSLKSQLPTSSALVYRWWIHSRLSSSNWFLFPNARQSLSFFILERLPFIYIFITWRRRRIIIINLTDRYCILDVYLVEMGETECPCV